MMMPDAVAAAPPPPSLFFCLFLRFGKNVEGERKREAPKRRQDLCRRRRKLKRLLRRSVGSFASEHAPHSLGALQGRISTTCGLPSFFPLFGRAVGRRTLGLSDFERPLRRREGGREGISSFLLTFAMPLRTERAPECPTSEKESE